MQNTVKLIKEFFDKCEWKYDFIEDQNIFSTNMNMHGIIGVLRIYVFVKETDYRVYAVLNNNAEKNAYPRVAEFLHRVNYGTPVGNFEFDYEDGEIRYKTYVDFEDVELSPSVIENSIFVPIFMFEKYGKNLFRAMLGDESIEMLVNDAEKGITDDSNEE